MLASRTYSLKLQARTICPHCWHAFSPEEILWVSRHPDLLGDLRLGGEQQQRFLPTRFTIEGDAIDSEGFTCNSIACPRCHLNLPRALTEMPPLFSSILGAPGSGKSYFLAAMTWALRQQLPKLFKVSLTDVEPTAHINLNATKNRCSSVASRTTWSRYPRPICKAIISTTPCSLAISTCCIRDRLCLVCDR